MEQKGNEAIGFIVCVIFALLCSAVVITIICNPERFTGFSYWWFLLLFVAAVIVCSGFAVTLWKKLRQPW